MFSHSNGQDEVMRTRNALLAYLERHPNAADTLEGICQWWLTANEICSHEIVLLATKNLVAQGRLEEQVLPDGRCIYRGRPTS